MTVREKTVRKLLTFSLISVFLVNQLSSGLLVFANDEVISSPSEVATESAEREFDVQAILNLIMKESTPSGQIATESAQATILQPFLCRTSRL